MGVVFGRIWERMFSKQEMRIVMLGLDGAGKSTILYRLKLGEVVCSVPTIGFNVETVEYRNINFVVWDIGGQDKIRALWHHYCEGARGLIFVVDSADTHRIGDAQAELQKILGQENMRDAALLVLANKQDLPQAMKVEEVADKLRLYELHDRPWFIHPTCCTRGEGLYEGLDWLSRTLEKRRRQGH